MSKLKRIIGLFLSAFLFFMPFINVYASGLTEQVFITLKINGQPIFVDSNPYFKQNRTFVPIRFVAEAFGMEADWIQEERKAVLEDEFTRIELWIDSNKLRVNDEEKTMDVNVEGQNGRTMVPVRFIAEVLDFNVEWDDDTYSVKMDKEGASIPAASVANRPYSDEDIVWLARIVQVEGLNLSVEGKVAIANVVLNRMKDTSFPETVYDVIFDARYGKQFPPAHKSGFKGLKPEGSCVIAAKMALEGINNIDKSLFFNHVPFKNKEQDLYKIIEGEYFYY